MGLVAGVCSHAQQHGDKAVYAYECLRDALVWHGAAHSLPLRNAGTFLLQGAACRNTEMHVTNQTE